MADQTNHDIAALQTEIKQLRADFAKIAGTIHHAVIAPGNGEADAMEVTAASTERAWTEIKQHAQNVGRSIEERPIAAAIVAFGTGAFVGLLLSRRRG
jgi:ElaB/YqjD/DUF883 family membrane-anchored ribosome-binding protein